MYSESLIEFLKNNWDKSSFISISLKSDIKNQIIQETEFLNSYYTNIPLRTRAYVIVNSITENTLPKCKCSCNQVCAIDKTYSMNGFRQYANSDCSRKDTKINENAKLKLENRQWLYDQRITQKKAIEQIANELNISTIPVVKYLKSHNIDKLIDARRRNSYSVKILSDKNKLKELYESGLTCEEIGKKLGISKATVSRWLNSHEIETRESNSYDRKIIRISKEETTLYDYIQSIYNEQIIQSNRSVLNGKELDIYLPKCNLAIEYNGLYSHCYRPEEVKESLIKGRSYHLQKTIECEKQGIQLLQFYSDEWLNKRSIIESVIKSKLKLNQKLYARNCQKVVVNTYDKNVFLNDNHIQGEDKSRIKLGLTYKNELVCVMTFCKPRFNKSYEWELSRFSSKSELNVIGGFSRLLKWFRNEYSGSVISYADRRYSNGNVYSKNGFQLIRTNSPSYYYVDKNYLERLNRMKFQKKYIGAYDCTEYEKARELGYNKIYDCGTLGFGLKA